MLLITRKVSNIIYHILLSFLLYTVIIQLRAYTHAPVTKAPGVCRLNIHMKQTDINSIQHSPQIYTLKGSGSSEIRAKVSQLNEVIKGTIRRVREEGIRSIDWEWVKNN